MMTNSLQLYRTLPLNDGENTQLFTFKLGLMNLDEFKSRSVRSTVINYQGQDWYLSCKYAEGKRHEFLGVYVYWGSPAEGVRCRADFRIITRNILDPTKSLVTEGSQVEFSAPQSPGWGKREFAPLRELFTPGQGFLLEPEKIVIIELAMKSCSTLFEQSVDFAQLLSHREQPYPSFFTANFPLAGMEFYLSLYPLGDREEADGHVSMYLHRFLGNEGEATAIGCRIRYRFFLGPSRTCPSSSKTFEFSFKNEQGYGRFKAFEPLNGSDNLLFRGAVPLGVEVLSITPFAQPEIRLTTRGYYHTDNFVFEDATFPDHRGNRWRLSATNGAQLLSLRLNAEDKNRLFSAPGLVPSQARLAKREECTKFVQWRAFVLSRTDRKKTLAVNGCPLSAYYSRGLMQTNYLMSTQIPLPKAKALDGDYCTKDEPSLLVRIEFLNVQDIAGVMTDYPTLDFERFQLYHTREGLKRCLKQNEALVKELEGLHGRLNNAVKESKDSRDLVHDFHKLLKSFQCPPEDPPSPPPPPPPIPPSSDQPVPPLPSNTAQSRADPDAISHSNAQLMHWLLQQPFVTDRDKGETSSEPNKQLPVLTPSARPASISSSPTLPAQQPPVARPRGLRGPPPRPPPRAYSPVATDLVNTRQFNYTAATSSMMNSPSPTSPPPPPPVSSAGMGMATEQQRLAVLNSNDTAFKRFSFTGINVTPAMISGQALDSRRNVDVPAQSKSSGKEPISSPQRSPTGPAKIQTQTQESKPPSSVPAAPSSVVMSRDSNTARGFALARMARLNVNAPQPGANQAVSQQQQPFPPPPQPVATSSNHVSWPKSLSVPPIQNSRSTGDLNNGPATNQTNEQIHLSNGDVSPNPGLSNGFQGKTHQSASNPNIASQPVVSSQKESKPLTSIIAKQGNVLKTTANGHHSPGSPHPPPSPSTMNSFEYSPVPSSVVNRRSPVPELMKTHASNPTSNAQIPESLSSTAKSNWPKTLPVPRNPTTVSSDSSLNKVSGPGSVLSRDTASQPNLAQEETPRHTKSTPSSPTKSVQKSGKAVSISTPTTPTKQVPTTPLQSGQQHHTNPQRLQQQTVQSHSNHQQQNQQQRPHREEQQQQQHQAPKLHHQQQYQHQQHLAQQQLLQLQQHQQQKEQQLQQLQQQQKQLQQQQKQHKEHLLQQQQQSQQQEQQQKQQRQQRPQHEAHLLISPTSTHNNNSTKVPDLTGTGPGSVIPPSTSEPTVNSQSATPKVLAKPRSPGSPLPSEGTRTVETTVYHHLSNGTDRTDGGKDRVTTVVKSVKEVKQIDVEPSEDPSNKRWSIPSIEERQRMGVIETSL